MREDDIQEKIKDIEKKVSYQSDFKIEVDEIIDYVCKYTACSKEVVFRRTKERKYVNIRKIIVHLCTDYWDVTDKSLVHKLNISPYTISKIKQGKNKSALKLFTCK
ncbi:hypothetical protein RH915_10700 [Serpentinicella sp. ANB-PHB4]|uniref:hypothetical protein n=1 Tax=Serpentinicella sp. ANB-PHB4 TaxID=3074076 RepID=UPI00285EC6A3|nr:hypothetical protein [Serpentinicella sp. ANB-PHB4]MDR5659958.1 hypothetical protein [Serpentinicella sp. ANB-PHB4]